MSLSIGTVLFDNVLSEQLAFLAVILQYYG